MEIYAERTTPVPPVATNTPVRGSPMRVSTRGIVGFSTHWTIPLGAPAASAAWARTRAASAQTCLAIGWGLMTTALRAISARTVLKYSAATGVGEEIGRGPG